VFPNSIRSFVWGSKPTKAPLWRRDCPTRGPAEGFVVVYVQHNDNLSFW